MHLRRLLISIFVSLFILPYFLPVEAATPTPTKTPTPTLTKTPTITPTPTHTSSCNKFTILTGNNQTVPATVTFRAEGLDNKGAIRTYRYYFGDGTQDETTSSEIAHRYEVSGTFFGKVEVKDTNGVWKSSNQCETTITVLSSSVESQKSDCSDLFITSGNNSQAPTTAKFTVSGYDNKGSVKKYKVEYGDGSSEEKTDYRFEKNYQKAGTYKVKGFVLDSRDSWKGGSGRCEKTLSVATTPLTKQPSTGTPTYFTILALTAGIWVFSRSAMSRIINSSR